MASATTDHPDGEAFAACASDGLASVVRSLTTRHVEECRSLKERLDAEYALREKDRQERIDELREDLTRATERLTERGRDAERLDAKLAVQNERLARCHRWRRALTVADARAPGGNRTVLTAWRRWAAEERARRRMEAWAAKMRRGGILRSCFGRWARLSRATRTEARLEAIVREIVGRYEAELGWTRAELSECRREVERGRAGRRRLEEDMRRTLLQGMTAMNVETLQLLDGAAQSDGGACQPQQHQGNGGTGDAGSERQGGASA